MEDSTIFPLYIVNAKFTWALIGARNYVECHLDRAFCSLACLDYRSLVSYVVFPHHMYDHNPLLLTLLSLEVLSLSSFIRCGLFMNLYWI